MGKTMVACALVVLVGACSGRSIDPRQGAAQSPLPDSPALADGGIASLDAALLDDELASFCSGSSKVRQTLLPADLQILDVSFEEPGGATTHEMVFECKTDGPDLTLRFSKALPPPDLPSVPLPNFYDLALTNYEIVLHLSDSTWQMGVKLKPSPTHTVVGSLDFRGGPVFVCLAAQDRVTGAIDLMLYLVNK